jgi:hypothetical protein
LALRDKLTTELSPSLLSFLWSEEESQLSLRNNRKTRRFFRPTPFKLDKKIQKLDLDIYGT